MTSYTPHDWYWDNGSDVFSSARQARVPYSDAAYVAWLAAGNVPTRDPGPTELRAVLEPYGIGLTPAETAAIANDRNGVKEQAAATVQAIDDYLALASPTQAQVRDQVRLLSQAMRRVIRRLVQID